MPSSTSGPRNKTAAREPSSFATTTIEDADGVEWTVTRPPGLVLPPDYYPQYESWYRVFKGGWERWTKLFDTPRASSTFLVHYVENDRCDEVLSTKREWRW
jgi:hypothetical protein